MAGRSPAGALDNTIRLWDAVTGAHKHTHYGHSSYHDNLAFSPDGGTLASGGGGLSGEGNTIRLWDAVTGALKHDSQRAYGWQVYSIAFSPDGGSLASESFDNTIRLWDALTGAQKHTIRRTFTHDVD